MENRPLVTFALFAYNQEKYIREAVEGAFAQAYSPLEIIISDDASPDKTFDIIKEMVDSYDGPHEVIINLNERNLGVGAHVEKVFRMARGEWLVAAAGDDISMPSRCEVLFAAVKRSGAKCMGVGSSWIAIDESGSELAGVSKAKEFMENQAVGFGSGGIEACGNILLKRTGQLAGSSAIWRTDLITKWPKFHSELAYEDVALSCRAHLMGKLVLIDDALIKYRTHDAALCNSQTASEKNSFRSRRISSRKHLAHLESMAICIKQFESDYLAFSSATRKSEFRPKMIEAINKERQRLEILIHLHKQGSLRKIIAGITMKLAMRTRAKKVLKLVAEKFK